jgi:hypothetical protein
MSIALVELYSYDDYKLWEGDWELLDGQPVSMAPAPMIKHQSLSFRIRYAFGKSTRRV